MTSVRAAPLPLLPGLLLGGAATLLRRKAVAWPEIAFAAHFAVAGIDMAHVARYRKLFDNPGTDVPLTYFYLLAQRAQLALMLDERFPCPLPGLIHSRNDLRQHAVAQTDSALDIHVAVRLYLDVGDVPKIACGVDIEQAGRLVVSCTSEYRMSRKKRNWPAVQAEPEKLPISFSQIDWTFEKQVIRRYAIVSGDYNPIHLSSLLARLFGFRSAIAHGMYSVGRAAAQIERQTSRPVTAISADFRRPIHLPAQAIFGLESLGADQGNYGVLLADQQKLALSGGWET